MALNSAVTPDGGEIGRAQVILQGHSIGNLEALDYHSYKPKAAAAVFDSYARLCATYAYVMVEGAGSPAEINLREGDIALLQGGLDWLRSQGWETAIQRHLRYGGKVINAVREQPLERLADTLEAHLTMDAILLCA